MQRAQAGNRGCSTVPLSQFPMPLWGHWASLIQADSLETLSVQNWPLPQGPSKNVTWEAAGLTGNDPSAL